MRNVEVRGLRVIEVVQSQNRFHREGREEISNHSKTRLFPSSFALSRLRGKIIFGF